MGMTETCAVKIQNEGNRPCGKAVVYCTANSERGEYSGWRHADPAHDVPHSAVPKSWVR